MADTSVARRSKKWAGRGRALSYRWYERWGDRRSATQDARAGIPAIPAAADGPPTESPRMALVDPDDRQAGQMWGTPRTVFLGQLGRSLAEREWISFQAETADVQVEHAQAQARRNCLRADLAAAQERLASLSEPSVQELTAPAPGEEGASPEVRTGRRLREHAARRDALTEDVQRQRTALDAAEVEVARLQDLIRVRREVAEVRVGMIEAYIRRRCSSYLMCLVRKHPDGARVGALIRSTWSEQPSWLRADAFGRKGGA